VPLHSIADPTYGHGMPCHNTASPSHIGTIQMIVGAGSEPAPTCRNSTSGWWLDPPSTVIPTIQAQHRCAPTFHYITIRWGTACRAPHIPSNITGAIKPYRHAVPQHRITITHQYDSNDCRGRFRTCPYTSQSHIFPCPAHINCILRRDGACRALTLLLHPIERHNRNTTRGARLPVPPAISTKISIYTM